MVYRKPLFWCWSKAGCASSGSDPSFPNSCLRSHSPKLCSKPSFPNSCLGTHSPIPSFPNSCLGTHSSKLRFESPETEFQNGRSQTGVWERGFWQREVWQRGFWERGKVCLLFLCFLVF